MSFEVVLPVSAIRENHAEKIGIASVMVMGWSVGPDTGHGRHVPEQSPTASLVVHNSDVSQPERNHPFAKGLYG
jgi:hypothetical protein